jgi:hypothetical protein
MLNIQEEETTQFERFMMAAMYQGNQKCEICKMITEWILEEQGGRVWSGCIWLRLGTTGGALSTR